MIDPNDFHSIPLFETNLQRTSPISINNRYGVILYDQKDEGRVVIASSTLHRDNCGLSTSSSDCIYGYQYNQAALDRKFTLEYINWLTSKDRLIIDKPIFKTKAYSIGAISFQAA